MDYYLSMPMVSTEDIYLFDSCPRSQLYSPFHPPRLPIGRVLNDALHAGLVKSPMAANTHVMEAAANPGLALPGAHVYSSAVHHAHLAENITFYLTGKYDQWKRPDPIDVDDIPFQPQSYIDRNRLHRIVLCSRYDDVRKMEETISWRTMADICATNLPMTIHIIVIGSLNKVALRPTPWTVGYTHRNVKDMRIKLRPDEHGKPQQFSKDWKMVYRENSSKSSEEWLKFMQWDRAFDNLSFVINVDSVADEGTQRQFRSIVRAIADGGRDEMRRASCFDFQPCQFAPLCFNNPPLTPSRANWPQRVG